MATLPDLSTPRLVLRALRDDDAPRIQLLANDRAVADTTRRLPFPYELKHAKDFLEFERAERARGHQATFAIVSADPLELVGVMGLGLQPKDRTAELGYWLGQPFWGRGFATEAAAAIVRYGFEIRGLNRVFAYCVRRNIASRRVLEKIGMRHEGCLRQHVAKWGAFEDLDVFGLLVDEWRKIEKAK